MYYIYSRTRCALVAGIHLDAFDLKVDLTNDTRFAMECDFDFINWLHQLDSISSYDIMLVRVGSYV